MQRREGAISRFLATETSGGVLLLATTLAAMVWANVSSSYDPFWHRRLGPTDLREIVNEGLMTIFFLVVGFEIKREFVRGDLRSARAALMPLVAAVGGMAAPAAIYLLLNPSGPQARGWAIPMATDIAFVLGVLALLGRRVPLGLRVFLLTLAIIDDIGAIVVIGVAYSPRVPVYLAGVAVALATPLEIRERPILETLERVLHPVSSYVVMPVFALANAGVVVSGGADVFSSRVFWGVASGLVIGKVVGIAGGALAARGSRVGVLPPGVDTHRLVGGAALGGIGFTVSLFITGLAFPDGVFAAEAKLGVFAGSLVSAMVGGLLLARQPAPTR